MSYFSETPRISFREIARSLKEKHFDIKIEITANECSFYIREEDATEWIPYYVKYYMDIPSMPELESDLIKWLTDEGISNLRDIYQYRITHDLSSK